MYTKFVLLAVTITSNQARGTGKAVKEIELYPVIREALVDMEVEHEKQSGSLEDDHLVTLVLPRDVSRVRAQPFVLGIQTVTKRK